MKQLLFLLMLCAATSNYAQETYVPMFDSINSWHYVVNYMPVIKQMSNYNTRSIDCQYPHYNFERQYTDGDTIIDSTTYLKLIEVEYAGQECLYGYLREDTIARTVYFLPNNDSIERMLYNFSMQIGDSINIDFEFEEQYSYYKSGMYYLDSVTMINIAGVERDVFHLNNPLPGYHHTLEWIEGLGCITDFVYTHTPNSQFYGGMFDFACPESPHDSHLFVTCFAHQEPIYIDSCAMNYAMNNSCFAFENVCRYYINCSGLSDITSLSDITLHPNPTQDNLAVTLDVSSNSDFSLSVIDVNGRTLIQPILLEDLSVGVHSKQLNIAHLAAGIHLLVCHNQTGTVYRKFIKQ